LRHIVQRFKKNIYASNVRELEVLSPDDGIFLGGLLTEYSTYEHDRAVEAHVAVPIAEKNVGRCEEAFRMGNRLQKKI